MRRPWIFALGALPLLGIGCGLAFSPGDYGGSATANATDAGSLDGALADSAPVGDAGPAAPLAHLLVITGYSGDGGIPADDIWTATFDQNGDVGSFVYNAANPIAGPVSAAAIQGNQLLLATYLGSNRIVEVASWDGGVFPAGYAVNIANTSSPSDYGQFFADGALVSIGGVTTSIDPNDGVTTDYDYDSGIWVSAPDGTGAYTDAGLSPTQPLTGFEAVKIAPYKSFAFMQGARVDAPDQASKIYVGTLDPRVGITNLQLTTAMLNPDTQSLHEPVFPMFCAGDGYLFVAGGLSTPTGDALDVVLFTTIDETTGQLAPWKSGPKLPDVLAQAGCFVQNHALYLVGGVSGAANGDAGTVTNRIIRSRVQSDGTTPPTMAGWELSAGQPLPSARSNNLALTY